MFGKHIKFRYMVAVHLHPPLDCVSEDPDTERLCLFDQVTS